VRLALATLAFAVVWGLGTAEAAEEAVDECMSCHEAEEEPELSEPVEQWRESVHAEAEVGCDACHGGDPSQDDEELAMDEDEAGFVGSPSWHEVPEFCGACHEDVLDGYSQSVMASKIEEGEAVAVCTTCHMPEGHAIVRPSAREILTEERCSECHDAERAVELRELLDETSGHIASVEAQLAALHGRIDTSRVDHEVQEIRARAVVIAHTYDRERIAEVAQVARERLDAAGAAADALRGESEFRRRLGFGVVAFFVLTCLGALRLESDVHRRGPT
jgi:hypothetical protein